MASAVDFIFTVHSHQPVGNFDSVFESACDDAYEPFLDLMLRHPGIKFCAHFSGSLLEWIEQRRIGIMVKIRNLVDSGRLELLGGGFYEPILSMLKDRDILGQIDMMGDFLARHFSVEPTGVWIPERVWEQPMVGVLAESGIRYTLLDDFHFKAVGLTDGDMTGHFLTEDRGRTIALFPMSEQLRYAIPFKEPEWTVEYLRAFAARGDRPLIVYADDGEKFGLWPKTFAHVYENRWLDRFLTALEENGEWLKTTTFSEALQARAPSGKVYLSSCSYREMGEWSVLPPGEPDFHGAVEELLRSGNHDRRKHFLPGGNWRNFKVKYPESAWMYGRMLKVSDAVAAMSKRGQAQTQALAHLYKAQCNCPYWHGVFGGIYLPFLRDAVYRNLIEAEQIARESTETSSPILEQSDVDLDGQAEVRLSNPSLNLYLSPARGGSLCEFDIVGRKINAAATLARRPEAYHRMLDRTPAEGGAGAVQSIHDIPIAAAKEIERHRVYDAHPKCSLVDHFFSRETTMNDVARLRHREWGDFIGAPYAFQSVKSGDRIAALLQRDGTVRTPEGGVHPVHVGKKVSIGAEGCEFSTVYTIKNHSREALRTIFGIEFNLSSLSPNLQESFYHTGNRQALASMTSEMEFADLATFGILNRVHGYNVSFIFTMPPEIWVFPVRTISRSEEGFELIYQCSSVIPRWEIALDPGKVWDMVITVKVEDI